MRKPLQPRLSSWTSSMILPLLLISFSSSVTSQNTKKICQTKECLSAAQNLKESMNFDANPCDNFYEYACGNWPKSHKNANIFSSGDSFTLRSDENSEEIFDFIKQNNSKDEPEAVHKARNLYSLCLNDAGYSNKLEPIETMLQKIGLPVLSFISGEIKNFDYVTALAKATRLAGIKKYFDLGVNANPFNQTFNLIGLKKPQKGFDPDIMPVAGHVESQSYKSKRAAKGTEQDFFNEVTKRMCTNSTSISCLRWLSPNNSFKDELYEEISRKKTEVSSIIAKPRSTLNSSIPVVYTLKQLQDLTDDIAAEVNTKIPKLNWTKYIEEMFTGVDNVTFNLSDPTKVQINIEELDFVKDMVRYIHESNNTKFIENGLWWDVVYTLLPYVDSELFKLRTSIADFTREQRCTVITVASFSMAVSYLYTTKEKYTKAKTEIRTMSENIRRSFQQIIEQASWLDEITRQRALLKLQLMSSNIAYPSIIEKTSLLNDLYKDLKITDNFYDTMISKIQNQITKKLNTLSKTNDIHEDNWIISPMIVAGYYDPNTNAFFIPAGMVGLSVYNNSLHALDYGGIGTIIGHEITHGFDNLGRRYNEVGNIEDWWLPETAKRYKEKATCFVKAYSNYSTTTSGIVQQTDSKLTLGEDISDNGGFKESLLAYKKYVAVSGEEPFLPQFENFTHEQLLTLAFANVWCENPTIESADFSKQFAVHSPHGVRVNGVLRNSKEFSEIWKCPKGSNMNLNEDKCVVW